MKKTSQESLKVNRLVHCISRTSSGIWNMNIEYEFFNQRFHAQSGELAEWKSALPGESEMYIFDAPGTPKFL